MEEAVRPSEDAFKSMYERGYRTWAALWEMAADDKQNYPLTSLSPVFPNHPYFPGSLVVDKSFSNAATVKGRTTWKTTQGPCDLSPFQQEVIMQVAWTHATTLVFNTDPLLAARFADCYGTESHHFPVLFLAWAYILSARWAELIPGAQGPDYNSCQAGFLNAGNGSTGPEGDCGSVVVEIGDADEDAIRWWAAVLSPECGWNASILSDTGALLCSPWSVRTQSGPTFIISAGLQTHFPTVHKHPASFSSAVGYLSQYCQLHGIAEQNQAALSAALLLPVAKFDGRRIDLPTQRPPSKVATRVQQETQALPVCGEDSHQLDRLLTLSCSPREVKALLSSVFFEPNVDCNICGAWLQGSFAFLDSDKASDPQILLRTMMKRDPDLGFLWLGAFVTGAEARCLQDARTGWWKTDLSTAAWTGTHVSFIQESVPKTPFDVREISRADECRLMYLCHGPDCAFPPIFPFAPFGSTAIEDTDLDVRRHVRCVASHGLGYGGFTWDCQGGKEVEQGVDDSLATAIRVKAGQPPGWNNRVDVDFESMDLEDEVSEMVTRNVFTWLRGEHGFPVAERAIREHEWIENLESDDDSPIEGEIRSTAGENLGRWLLLVSTKRSNSL